MKWVTKTARMLVVTALVVGSLGIGGLGGIDPTSEGGVPVAKAAVPSKTGATSAGKPVTASATKPVAKPSDYSQHWAKDWIDWSINNKLMWKYADGTFRPDETVTQAQFLSALVKVQGLKEKSPHPPTAKHWAKDVYEMVAKAGWFTPDIKVNPDGRITRYEAAAWITNAWGHKTYDPLQFTYKRNLMEASYKFQRGLYSSGNRKASSDYNYYFKMALPGDKFTRGEAVHTLFLINDIRKDLIEAQNWYLEFQKSLYVKSGKVYGKVPNNIPKEASKNGVGVSFHPVNVKPDGSNILVLNSGQAFSVPSNGKIIMQGGHLGRPTVLFVWNLPNLQAIDEQNRVYSNSNIWNNRNK
ncbi:S-layer homology domain-containing protein [Brevibacillus dissolubilis]|uniref:S-layer homology domain-containing protein n=1 Tax=Brevibacillus dissolubilis TaxID=1844116 RepID=UPI00159B9A1D|nr:S-layer homology domain-containing protein [Brevibacillus dissolubilis]